MSYQIRKHRGVVSKIDRAGEKVIKKILELITSNLGNQAIADKINREFKLDLKRINIYYFRKKILPKTSEEANQIDPLTKLRMGVLFDYTAIDIKDMSLLNKQLEKLKKDNTMDIYKKAKLITKIIDQRGKILMRHAKLTGKI